ncbi:MFS transporter [Nesterenkonia haasae]|uniref:MFS transporter n=1 Tax=Nesterenkonia haasae TaxID=2587813 RepID=UPI0013914AE3|nr:MFS transporter [Nesterenkonia haasae]NDK32353.1 MFS transporter [Nesterenkonia haasae]
MRTWPTTPRIPASQRGESFGPRNRIGRQPHRPIVAAVGPFWVTLLVSSARTAALALAFPWLALQETGSPTLIGALGAVTLIGSALVAPLFGPLIDMIGRWRVAVCSDALLLILCVLAAGLAFSGVLGISVMLVLAPLMALARGISSSSRKGIVPDLAEDLGIRYATVSNGREATIVAGFIAGPLIGGFLLRDGADGSLVFLLGAGLSVVGLVGMLSLPQGVRRPRENAVSSTEDEAAILAVAGSRLRRIRSIVPHHPELRRAVLMTAAIAGVVTVFQNVAAPVIAEQAGDAEQLGYAVAGYAVGGVTGVLIHVLLSRKLSRAQIVRLSIGVAAVGFVAVPFLIAHSSLFFLGTLVGLALGLTNPIWAAVTAEYSPYRVRASITSAQALLSSFVGGGLSLLAGLMTEHMGPVPVVLGVGIFWGSCSLLWLWRANGEKKPVPVRRGRTHRYG